jgi:hypothetical protein
MKQWILAGAFVAGITVLTGCPGAVGVGVAYGPPPPRYGVVGVAPGPGYVWTDGYWDLNGRNWVWAPGRWTRRPYPDAMWERPEWRHDGNRWRFHHGGWRRGGHGDHDRDHDRRH